jgi:hypothetical protein
MSDKDKIPKPPPQPEKGGSQGDDLKKGNQGIVPPRPQPIFPPDSDRGGMNEGGGGWTPPKN